MKITKAKLKNIIKEELEVVLTNEEVEEMFGEEVRAQVEAMESKEITKEAIMEEIQSDPALLDAIEKLTDSIEGLDVSIDFLSAAFTGESGVSIGAAQRQLGRAYRPKALPPPPMKEALGMDQEAQLSKKIIPLLMQIAGGDKSVAAEIIDELSSLVDQLPNEDEIEEGLFGGDFDIGKKKSPKPGKKLKRTKAEKEKLNRFLKATAAKEIDERKLSKGEEKEKEKIVKGMKKSKKDFKKRYGDDAESVMYATATKIAKDKK
jgi:hypothetical protein